MCLSPSSVCVLSVIPSDLSALRYTCVLRAQCLVKSLSSNTGSHRHNNIKVYKTIINTGSVINLISEAACVDLCLHVFLWYWLSVSVQYLSAILSPSPLSPRHPISLSTPFLLFLFSPSLPSLFLYVCLCLSVSLCLSVATLFPLV